MPKSILIVDDSEIVRGIIRAFLQIRGYTVCGEGADGFEAIEKAKLLKPDLILLDLQMPRLNGTEAAPVLKRLFPQVPIILFTMFSEAVTASWASAVGVDLVVSKPDGIGKLADHVEKLLGPATIAVEPAALSSTPSEKTPTAQ